jgi:hypothetical protein
MRFHRLAGGLEKMTCIDVAANNFTKHHDEYTITQQHYFI